MIQTVIKRDGRIVGFNEEKDSNSYPQSDVAHRNGEDRELVRQITDHISFKGARKWLSKPSKTLSSWN